MLKGQLLPNKLTCKALQERFLSIPRESFTPLAVRRVAYMDDALPLTKGRALFPPIVLAQMLQALDVQKTDNLLIVAGNTGYTAALLAPLAAQITMVEKDESLLDIARQALRDCNALEKISIKSIPPQEGYKASAPYTKIFLDAPAEEIPATLLNQLSPGGRLVAAITGKDGVLEATCFDKKTNKTTVATALFETGGAVLPAFRKKEKFTF